MADQSKYNEIPAAACVFLHEAQIDNDANGENAKTAPIKIFARSAQPIDHWWWGRVVHDMAGMTGKDRIPIDYCHDDKEVIGFMNKRELTDDGLLLSGALVPFAKRQDDRATEVLHKSALGVPYEGSIDFRGEMAVEDVPAGVSTEVNGFQFAGPGVVIRQWTLRGVALCPYGADANTHAEFSNQAQRFSAKLLPTKEKSDMGTDTCPGPAKQFGANLGRELGRLRDEQEKTNEQLGNAAGISADTVGQIISGEINCPPMERLQGFAEELGVSVQSLVDAAEEDGCTYGQDDDSEQMTQSQAVETAFAEAAETPAVDAKQVEATPEPTNEAEAQTATFSTAEFQRIAKNFGAEVAAEVVAEGGDYNTALQLSHDRIQAENSVLQEKVAKLTASQEPSRGTDPVTFGDGSEAKKKKKLRDAKAKFARDRK